MSEFSAIVVQSGLDCGIWFETSEGLDKFVAAVKERYGAETTMLETESLYSGQTRYDGFVCRVATPAEWLRLQRNTGDNRLPSLFN